VASSTPTWHSTFDLSVSSLLRASNIEHYKSLGCLVKSHDKVVKFGLGRHKTRSPESVGKTPFAQEHVNPKLVMVRAVSCHEMLRNRIREILSGGMTARLPLGNEFRIEDGAISIDEGNNTVTL
jgi:hypothetical protein